MELPSYPDKPLLSIENLPFPKIASGKVREIFDLEDAYLMIATDRISAFDVVFNEGLSGKGILLTQISLYWFSQLSSMTRHHLVENHEERCKIISDQFPELTGRMMIVRKLKPLCIEAIVRGYLAGSAWSDYQKNQTILGYELPAGFSESSRLDHPLFTPTTKAQSGHDIPISVNKAKELIGHSVLDEVQELSLNIFEHATKQLDRCGLILADTKFEFGLDDDNQIYLIDEVLTPDSSRYWFKDNYVEGEPQDPVDKQFIRDYLNTIEWDKRPPAPDLPASVINETLKRYEKAYQLITSLN
jgi:phosphoribosylaminoimidazole-succinocarboxamide synthase